MAEQDEVSARVTLTMLYKELRETKEMVIQMRSDLHAAIKQGEDHEKRIRALEQWRWVLTGVALASGSLGAWLARLFG